MLGLILVAALALESPPETPMWLLNFSVTGPAEPCLGTTRGRALDGLKTGAAKSPKADFAYQWLNDNGERVLRVIISRGVQKDVLFFTYKKKFCENRWADYYKNELWGHDERYVTHVTAKGIVPPRLKWNGEPTPGAP